MGWAGEGEGGRAAAGRQGTGPAGQQGHHVPQREQEGEAGVTLTHPQCGSSTTTLPWWRRATLYLVPRPAPRAAPRPLRHPPRPQRCSTASPCSAHSSLRHTEAAPPYGPRRAPCPGVRRERQTSVSRLGPAPEHGTATWLTWAIWNTPGRCVRRPVRLRASYATRPSDPNISDVLASAF